MKRTELYNHIKGLNLQKEIEARTGKNFTRCSNGELEVIVIDVLRSIDEQQTMEGGMKRPKGECKCECECNEPGIDPIVALDRLIEVLYRKKILLDSELNYILQRP